jgi:uncharacterized protein YeeX (DUF496 family)
MEDVMAFVRAFNAKSRMSRALRDKQQKKIGLAEFEAIVKLNVKTYLNSLNISAKYEVSR